MSGTPQDAGQPVVTPTPTPTESDKSQVQAEETKTPEAATEGENQDGKTTTDEGQPEPRKRNDGGFQRRINRLTADFRAAQAKAEAAEAKARELEAKLTKPAQGDELKAPQLKDFTSYEEYERADRAFIAEQTRRETLRTLEEKQKADAAKQTAEAEAKRIKEARERFDDAAEAIADQYEDFDDFIDDLSRGRTPLRDLGGDALREIFEHDDPKIGAALGFHLHTHPEEVKRLAALPPSKQIRELARLEASLPKPGAKNVSNAPPPPKQVGSRGGPDGKDESKMSIPELRRHTGSRARVPD